MSIAGGRVPSEMMPIAASRDFDGVSMAAGVLSTARAVLRITPAELADAAGCAEALVQSIEAGDLDPTLDTLDRIANAIGLEIRAGPHQPTGHYRGPEVDYDEVERLQEKLAALNQLRDELGAGPPGPPTGAQPEWDGQDPAPGRQFGSGPTRTDGGGWAALIVRSARAETGVTTCQYAASAGIKEDDLDRIESGELRPPVGELARILDNTGTGLRMRLEPYDDHDDGLHLKALADPELHDRRMRRNREVFAGATGPATR